jgi:hypothetical protein
MTSSDRPAFSMLMARMTTAFRSRPLPAYTEDGFFELLEDLRLDQVCVAVGRAVKESRWRKPVPLELREFVLGAPDEQAALAWSTVKRLVHWPALLRKFELRDAWVVAFVVDSMGGWEELESWPDLDRRREEFIKGFHRAVFEVQHRRLPLTRKPQDNVAIVWSHLAEPPPLTRDGDLWKPVTLSAVLTPDQEAERIRDVRTVLAAASCGGLG